MNYPEAQQMLMKHLPYLLSNPNFIKGGHNCHFNHLFIAPESSDFSELKAIYERVFMNGYTNDEVLIDLRLISKPLRVFLTYLSQGVDIIIPLDAHLKEITT